MCICQEALHICKLISKSCVYVIENKTALLVLKVDVKLYTLDELFKNEPFRKFAPYFLDEPRTILEVERLSYGDKYKGWQLAADAKDK